MKNSSIASHSFFFSAGSLGVGTYLVRWLPGAELLSEEPTDQRDTDGHSVPLPDLARSRCSQVNQSPVGLQEVNNTKNVQPSTIFLISILPKLIKVLLKLQSCQSLARLQEVISKLTQKCPTINYLLSILPKLKSPFETSQSYQSTVRCRKVDIAREKLTGCPTVKQFLSFSSFCLHAVKTLSIISKCHWNLDGKLSI